MSGYYAFNWRPYHHAVHPQTLAAIVETSFMMSEKDCAVIVDQPEVMAKGIAERVPTLLRLQGANPVRTYRTLSE
ncbi:hypothetical protein JNK62_04595 [bacterium]|nr:hypothetical protein [bacterium]